jgi:RNA ligase
MLPCLDQLAPYVASRLVSRVNRGPLAIFNYTQDCVYAGAWDAVTLAARGLVLDVETGECVARSFDKFFNHGEPAAPHPPEAPPDVVTVKLDGSLGISYRLDGETRWTTRGSFYSPQAAVAERIWRGSYAKMDIPDPLTLLVEIISPDTRNICRYDFEDLVVIGLRDRRTCEDLAWSEVEAFAAERGLRCADRVDGGLAELTARARQMDHTEEGFVLRWGDLRLKVKSSEYLRVARLIAGMTDRAVADLWYAGRLDLLAPLPEEHRGFAMELMERLDEELVGVGAEYTTAWAAVADLPDRKAVALAVQGQPLFGAVMQRFGGRVPDLKLEVYRRRHDARPREVG